MIAYERLVMASIHLQKKDSHITQLIIRLLHRHQPIGIKPTVWFLRSFVGCM